MGRIEKTVFISYRRNTPWFARAVYQSLTLHGYDVFLDYTGLASGDFERVILENIRARAHFLVMLTPSALKRCKDPADWLRREIETALESQRNIVSLTQEGFNFSSSAVKRQLTGSLELLKHYNALNVPADYFDAAMDKLRERFLNVALDTILHPVTPSVAQAAKAEQASANSAAAVTEKELTAQEWFERAFNSTDPEEQLTFYTEAIRLNPNDANAFNNRGLAQQAKGDLDAAIRDYIEAIRLNPNDAEAFNNRGNAQQAKGDLDAAIRDYDEAIRLNPDSARVFYNRGLIWQQKDQASAAISDFQKYLDLGGGLRDGDTEKVEQRIRDLRKTL
jgi:tetratricopeptide (TPR) repeat protein